MLKENGMRGEKYLFLLMRLFFAGFAICLAYGLFTSAIIWTTASPQDFQDYQRNFFVLFNCIFSGGLAFSAAFIVYSTQTYVDDLIISAFSKSKLPENYKSLRDKLFSRQRSARFSSLFFIVGVIIFILCDFPLQGLGKWFMIVFASIQYAIGVYIGRKLFYIAQLLHSIEDVPLHKDIFKNDELGGILLYVNLVSTATMVFGLTHLFSYYYGPFTYSHNLFNFIPNVGDSTRVLLLFPGVIATPVIILFNFYPRLAVKKIYKKSIRIQLNTLREEIANEELSDFERLSYVVEYDKIYNDELNNRMRATLGDLPVAISILGMMIGLLFTFLK